jgi:toxin ParE1/3/4
MAELIWTEPALRQLEEIIDTIALDKPTAAENVVRAIFDKTGKVETFRFLGRSIPEFPHENYRQLWVSPCWIYYRVTGEIIYILHVRRAENPLKVEELK